MIHWVKLPFEDTHDTMGRRRRRLSRAEAAFTQLGDGKLSRVRTRDGRELTAMYSTTGHGTSWLPCDENGCPLTGSDRLDVIAVLVAV